MPASRSHRTMVFFTSGSMSERFAHRILHCTKKKWQTSRSVYTHCTSDPSRNFEATHASECPVHASESRRVGTGRIRARPRSCTGTWAIADVSKASTVEMVRLPDDLLPTRGSPPPVHSTAVKAGADQVALGASSRESTVADPPSAYSPNRAAAAFGGGADAETAAAAALSFAQTERGRGMALSRRSRIVAAGRSCGRGTAARRRDPVEGKAAASTPAAKQRRGKEIGSGATQGKGRKKGQGGATKELTSG